MLYYVKMETNNAQHFVDLCTFYDVIIESVTAPGEPLYKFSTCTPGWNEHVGDLHTAAMESLNMWCDARKPRQSPIFELKKHSNARLKYSLRFIKKTIKTQ